MKVRAFITHKKAENFQDCQDRFSVNMGTKSIAVSDGMSQSIFQKIWAEILVDAYTRTPEWTPSNELDHSTVKTILSPTWMHHVKERLKEMQIEGRNTTRTENSLALGGSAGATLIGVRFNGRKWFGDVLGDSCLIEVKDFKISRFLTSQDGDSFDNHPDYYDSNPNKQGKGFPKAIDGELSSGMYVLLVSDPFSDFFMEQIKNGNESQFLDEILSVNSHESFEDLVSRWRTSYGMHNDDSTLIIIEPDGSDELNILFEDKIEKLIEDDAFNTPKTAANPFHHNILPIDGTIKNTTDSPIDSKSSNHNDKGIECRLQELSSTEPPSTPTENGMESVTSSDELTPSSDSLAVPSIHHIVQDLKEENDHLQIDLDDARNSCEIAQKEAKKLEEKNKSLSAEKINIEKERDSYRRDKEALENDKQQLNDALLKGAEEKEDLVQRIAELNTKYENSISFGETIEEKNRQLHSMIMSLQDSIKIHESEIVRKNEEIKKLEDKLRLAQNPRPVERSVVRSLCLSEYESFMSAKSLLFRIMPGADQRDVMSKIVNRLFEGPYLIIKR